MKLGDLKQDSQNNLKMRVDVIRGMGRYARWTDRSKYQVEAMLSIGNPHSENLAGGFGHWVEFPSQEWLIIKGNV